MESKKRCIVVVCYNRPEALVKTLTAIEKANKRRDPLIIVCQRGNSEVESMVTDWPGTHIQRIFLSEKSVTQSARYLINRNVYTGLSVGFNQGADYVTVIEDDIEVHPRFLDFVDQIQNDFGDKRYFRAVNGFSARTQSMTTSEGFGMYRFGVGWGWSINRKTWTQLGRFWRGDEDAHWDGIIEPYMRTGFVVMPNFSLIRNLGLNGSGTNTGVNPVLEQAIEASYNLNTVEVAQRWNLLQSDINWRKDCLNFQDLKSVRSIAIQVLFFMNLYFQPTSEFGSIGSRLKQKARALVFRLAILMD